MITTILEHQYVTAVTEVGNFTVNTAATKVSLVTGTNTTLYDNANNLKAWFQPHDGVLIKSIYCRMPYQFCMADAALFFFFLGVISPATSYQFPELGEPGSNGFCVQLENYETEINTYIAPPPAAVSGSLKWKLTGVISSTFGALSAAVSMVNVPSSLNGLVLPVYLGVKIVHAYPLTVTA